MNLHEIERRKVKAQLEAFYLLTVDQAVMSMASFLQPPEGK